MMVEKKNNKKRTKKEEKQGKEKTPHDLHIWFSLG
jgi:hypothetical protein